MQDNISLEEHIHNVNERLISINSAGRVSAIGNSITVYFGEQMKPVVFDFDTDDENMAKAFVMAIFIGMTLTRI